MPPTAMSPPTFTFLNHAGFIVRTDSALLLADPWLEGPVLGAAWSLIDPSTRMDDLIRQLNQSGLPVFIWCSRPQPDRLPLAFLRRFRSEFRGIATFLYRQGRDWRLADELRRHRCALAPCPEGRAVALGADLRLTAFANGESDAWCLVKAGRRHILCLGERALATRAQCQLAASRIRRAAPRIDLLLTGFADMRWCGNPDGSARREEAARQGVARLARQAEAFKPRLIVPVASFARFARADNGWLNHGRASPAQVLESARLEAWRGAIRFLRPGASIDLEHDDAVSLTARHDEALAHWMRCWREPPPPLPRPLDVGIAALRMAFQVYRGRVDGRLYGLARLLEALRLLRPLRLHLPDQRQTILLSYRQGLRQLARDAPADVAMCSGTAHYLLRAEDGFDVTYAGGCFWIVREGGLRVFGRFFLPQRMGRRGIDRARPLEMGRFLLRALAGHLARRLGAALR